MPFSLWLSLEKVFRRAITGRPASGGWVLLDSFLACISYLYGACVFLRNLAYRAGILRRVRLPCPVISVGNISLGGTGKTPMVRWLARHLVRKGYSVLVLSRGYGRLCSAPCGGAPFSTDKTLLSAGWKPALHSDDESFGLEITPFVAASAGARDNAGFARLIQAWHGLPAHDYSRAGSPCRHLAECDDSTGSSSGKDASKGAGEPKAGMIFRLVGPDRAGLALRAMELLRPLRDRLVVVLDDGFQHLRLERDVDIVMVSCLEPGFENARLFPVGPFRELPAALSRAQVIVLAHTDACGRGHLETTRRTVKRHAPRAVFVECRHRVSGLRSASDRTSTGREGAAHAGVGVMRETPSYPPAARSSAEPGAEASLGVLAGLPVLAFCGIGKPEQFVTSLTRTGASVVRSVAFPDHHVYDKDEVLRIQALARANGARALVTTQKDAARLEGFSFSLPLYVLMVELELDDPQGKLDETLTGTPASAQDMHLI